MPFQMLIYPALAQMALTFILLYRLMYLRASTLISGKIKYSQIALGQNVWPEHILKTDNCFHNQLETPLLFYFLIALVGITNKMTPAFVILGWLFFFFRIWHAKEELTANNVRRRFYAFFGSTFALLAMWVIFALQL